MGEQILIRLEGEPDYMPDADQFGGWPPPERLARGHSQDAQAGGLLDPEAHADAIERGEVIVEKCWRKISQSEISDEEIAEMSHVVRGARYEEER